MKILQMCMISAFVLALSGCLEEKKEVPAKPAPAVKVAPSPEAPPAKK